MSDSVRPHRWRPTRLPRPWDSPGKSSGVWCHCLLHLRVYHHLNKSSLCFLDLPVVSEFLLQGNRNLPSNYISGGVSQISVKPQLLTSFVLERHCLNSCFSLSFMHSYCLRHLGTYCHKPCRTEKVPSVLAPEISLERMSRRKYK